MSSISRRSLFTQAAAMLTLLPAAKALSAQEANAGDGSADPQENAAPKLRIDEDFWPGGF